tara:strand:+ start:363 stop:908 length:546 start_codon:yes stop_codon:yes gene_type:complete
LFLQPSLSQEISLQIFQHPALGVVYEGFGLYQTTLYKKSNDRLSTMSWSKSLNRYGLLFQIEGDSGGRGGIKYGKSRIKIIAQQFYRCRLFATRGDPKECLGNEGDWLYESYEFNKVSDQFSLYLGESIFDFMTIGIQWNLFWNIESDNIEVLKLNLHSSMLEEDLKERFVEYFLKFYTKL